jgi:hypothetical protein
MYTFNLVAPHSFEIHNKICLSHSLILQMHAFHMQVLNNTMCTLPLALHRHEAETATTDEKTKQTKQTNPESSHTYESSPSDLILQMHAFHVRVLNTTHFEEVPVGALLGTGHQQGSAAWDGARHHHMHAIQLEPDASWVGAVDGDSGLLNEREHTWVVGGGVVLINCKSQSYLVSQGQNWNCQILLQGFEADYMVKAQLMKDSKQPNPRPHTHSCPSGALRGCVPGHLLKNTPSSSS